MTYQEFEPGTELNLFVKCYWILESPKQEIPEKQTIVADGCMEMIFHYGDLYKQYIANGKSLIQPRCFVIGQLTQPLEIEPTGLTGIFGVRFHPGGFLPFATVSIKEMENTAVPLEELFAKDGENIQHAIRSAQSTTEKINLIETFLRSQLTSKQTVDRIVKSAVATILTANGQLSISELSKQNNIHRRQLERKFSAAVGLSPKQLSKIIRLQSALKMLLNKKFTNLTDVAYQNEYYDQAHLIKDFKELTGITPKEFYGNNLRMTSFFF